MKWEIQNQTNNNTIHVYSSCKKQKFDLITEYKDEEDKGENIAERLKLAHTIIDLLNTIEAGAKGTVIRTTEVCKVLKLAVLSVKYFFISLREKSKYYALETRFIFT